LPKGLTISTYVEEDDY